MKEILEGKLFNFLQSKKIELEPYKVEVLKSRNEEFGNYSTNLPMKLTKFLKQNPLEIAKELKTYLLTNSPDIFDDLTITKPGFVNMFLTTEIILKNALEFYDPNYSPKFNKLEKCNINYEFVSANPTGDLHVGHARNALVGDATIKLLETAGHTVHREFWINDAGMQMENLAKAIYYYYIKELTKKEPYPIEEVSYKGIEIKEYGIELAKSNPEFKDLSQKEAEDKIRPLARDNFLARMKVIFDQLGLVPFDTYTSELSFYESGEVDRTIKLLKKNNATYEKDGALWLKSKAHGDDKDRVLVKSDGSMTYMVPDIGYHSNKFARGFDTLIDLWGADHHGYEKRLKIGVSMLGHDINKINVDFINMVQIKENGTLVKMSKRAGTSLRIKDILELVDPQILRYSILSKSKEQSLEIDLTKIKEETQTNPFFYNQYANARIFHILEKYKKEVNKTLPHITNFIMLGKDLKENDLLLKMVEYPDVILQANKEKEPSIVTKYLKDLAQEFNSYYNVCMVISEDDQLTNERITLMIALKNLFEKLFYIIGITPLNKM